MMKKHILSAVLTVVLLLVCLPLMAAADELPELETEQHIVYIEGANDLVKPNGNLTRAEAAKIVSTLLKSEEESPAAESTFTDVPEGSWCEPYVRKLTGLGVFQGYSDGTFKPNNSITRAEFVQVLSRFFEPETTDAVFTDVPEDFWGFEAISTAVAKGWTKGYGDGTFGPWRKITRAEAIAMMNRVLGRGADRTKIAAEGQPMRFLDLPVSHWAYYDIMEASVPHEFETSEEGAQETWQSCTIPKSQRGEGPQYYNGETYYVSNGLYVHDADAAGMHFAADGRFTTGDTELDALLTQIFKSKCKETNTPEQNLRCMFNYVYAQTHYRGGEYIADGATGWINRKAKETIRSGYKGNCYNYAALMTVLAQRVGVQATAYSGYAKFTFQSYWAYHAWCEVTIDGKRYICDPELEANFVKNLGLGWKLYKVPYASLPYKLRCKGVIFQ